jgi:hypothetical protein
MPRPLQRKPVFLLLAGILFLGVSLCLAQTVQEPQRVLDGGTREMLVSIFVPSTPNAPFTATVNTEWVRPLPDGTRITLKNHRLIARDKTGRIFQERRMLVPDDAKSESIVTQTEISDPVTHELYTCRPNDRACHLNAFEAGNPFWPLAGVKAKPGVSTSPESLGKQSIAGMETTGTREMMVIPTGAIGNDGPILSKREYWYSKQLGMNVLSIREDPRFGTQKFELSDVVVGEPDAKLFEPPEGFRIVDVRTPVVVRPSESAPAR